MPASWLPAKSVAAVVMVAVYVVATASNAEGIKDAVLLPTE